MKSLVRAVASIFTSVFLSVALMLGLVHVMPPVSPDWQTMRESTREFQVQLPNSNGGDNLIGICSGVMIDATTFLTAAHCDVTTDYPKLKIYVDGHPGTVVKKDEKKDLLMVFVQAGCPCVPTATDPRQDEVVYVVGYPLGVGQILTEGRAQGMDKRGFLTFTAPIAPGNSGGPVFVMRNGHPILVAIVSSTTLVFLGGIFPNLVLHLNSASGYDNIVEFLIQR